MEPNSHRRRLRAQAGSDFRCAAQMPGRLEQQIRRRVLEYWSFGVLKNPKSQAPNDK
jgi:hypothetical protein